MPKPPKVELPAQLDQAYAPTEGATVPELQAQIQQVKADAIKVLDSKEGSHAERMAKAQWYQAAIAAMETRQNELVQTDAEEKAALDEMRKNLVGEQPEGEGAEGDEEDDPADPDAPSVDSGGDGAPAGDAGAPNTDGVLVASSSPRRGARGSAIRAAARSGSTPPVTSRKDRKEAYLTAAAEIPGFAAGQRIDWNELGRAAIESYKKMPDSLSPQSGRQMFNIGRVNIPSDERLVASAARGDIDLDAAIEWALSNERLKAETGSDTLLAAGGWCAPSEVLYDLIDLITTDGMVDVPGITVNRGGVRYSLGPDFTAVYNAGANFTRTETQTIAGVAKPIVNIPCPSFTDNRMVVDGLYLTGDILSSKGYPEAYADFLQKALKSFAHYVNAQSINDMVQLSGTAINLVTPGSPPYPNKAISTELLGAVELQVTDMRYKNRLSMTQAVEIIFPAWLKGAIRSDLAKRQAVENSANISDADIEGYFAERGANVQWVYDWQDAFTGISGGFGSASAITAWPTSAQFLIHPQGTFVRALSDVIELNAVYDSTLLTTNQYVALFMEQARLTLKRAWDARLVTVPVVVSGATGAPFDYTTTQPTV